MSTQKESLPSLTPTSAGLTHTAAELPIPPLGAYSVFIHLVNIAPNPTEAFEYVLEIIGFDRGLEFAMYEFEEDFTFEADGFEFDLGQAMRGQAAGVFEFENEDISGHAEPEKQDFTVVVVYAKRDASAEAKLINRQIPLGPLRDSPERPDKKILVWFAFGDPETGSGGQGQYGEGGDGGMGMAPPPFRLYPGTFGGL